MPLSAPKQCSHPGCSTLTRSTRCPRHQAVRDAGEARRKAEYEAKRPSRSAQGYDTAWFKVRAVHLSRNPMCVDCGMDVRTLPPRQRHADHIRPFRNAPDLRLDPANLATRCGYCHSRKTASFDGGFGNPTRGQ